MLTLEDALDNISYRTIKENAEYIEVVKNESCLPLNTVKRKCTEDQTSQHGYKVNHNANMFWRKIYLNMMKMQSDLEQDLSFALRVNEDIVTEITRRSSLNRNLRGVFVGGDGEESAIVLALIRALERKVTFYEKAFGVRIVEKENGNLVVEDNINTERHQNENLDVSRDKVGRKIEILEGNIGSSVALDFARRVFLDSLKNLTS